MRVDRPEFTPALQRCRPHPHSPKSRWSYIVFAICDHVNCAVMRRAIVSPAASSSLELATRLNVRKQRQDEKPQRTWQRFANQSHLQEIHFLWRPFLSDPDDDMILELAFAANCRHIITHNVADFHGSEKLGVTALSPREFLHSFRKKP